MKFAYADPPYLGQGKKHYGELHADASDWDFLDAHEGLIDQLRTEFQDGWAMSASVPSLRFLAGRVPKEARIMAWVKPFCSFKPGVGVAYAWEPVLVCGGRKRTRQQPTVRDWCSANITLKKGCPGAKPPAFCHWLFEVFNAQPDDELVDLFPGSGGVAEAWSAWMRAKSNMPVAMELMCEQRQ